ncbi:MAG: cation transporter, partial [Thiomonas delicata]
MNTTSVIDVSGLVSSLSARGVEKQLRRLPGVADVQVNYVAGSATVVYDAALTNLAALQAQVERCGYHCRGESVPGHLCEPREEHAVGHAQSAHKARVEPGLARLQGAEHDAHSGRATGMDAMVHDMGHGAGMDARAMARDMRNRFWVCLFFTVPLFVYSPMGGLFEPPAPPLL